MDLPKVSAVFIIIIIISFYWEIQGDSTHFFHL